MYPEKEKVLVVYEYVKSPIICSKFIVAIACTATLVLTACTRPTELQKSIVHSTWKEDGLFISSITVLVMVCISMILETIFRETFSTKDMRMKEVIVFAVACALFSVFGCGTLESALTIFSQVGECCDDYHNETNATCTLPGLIEQYYGNIPSKSSGNAVMTFDLYNRHLLVPPPELIECKSEVEDSSWLCTVCVNKIIQPNYDLKGASGAAGLISALACFIVVYVGFRETRAKKLPNQPTLSRRI